MVSNITPISLEKNGQKLNGGQFKTTLLLATLLSMSVLAGCGGGGGSDNAATTTDTSGTTTTTTNNTGSTTTNTGTNTNTGNTGSTGTTTGTGTGTTTTTAKTFTKLDKDGGDVTAGIESVACVKDSQTGKYWEVKTDEPAGQTMKGETYQDKDYGYFWYDGKAGVPGYDAGTAVTASLLSGFSFPCQKTTGLTPGLTQCDTGSYIAAVNAAKLCGFKDNGWRLPTKDELLSLIDKSKTAAPYTYTDLGSTSYDPEAKDQLVRGYWSSTASTAVPTTNRLAVSFTGKDDNRVQDHPMGNLINDYIRLIHD